MPIKSIVTAVSALSLLSVATVAQAGSCGGSNCSMGVDYLAGSPAKFGPMTVADNHPMGHLRTVDFQRSPHVSIMRVHGMAPNAALSDAPVGFTSGCHPQSTQYCRQDAGMPVNVEFNAPMMAPTAPAPTTYLGGGYDASKFAPRQYGDNTFVPGIAHIPTSIVDRSPENADRALNSGRAVPQPIANGGFAPRPSMVSAPMYRPAPMMQPMMAPRAPMPVPMMMAPPMRAPQVQMFGRPAGAPVLQPNGSYGSTVGSDGTYWEKVSGPTFMGDTLATQVICKRKVETQVVNPVVGVPVPVPTRLPMGCATSQPHAKHAGHSARYAPNHAGWAY